MTEIRECLPKLATGIRGFDKILYGGIDVNTIKENDNTIIVIKGTMAENDKILLGATTIRYSPIYIENKKGI